MNNLAESLAGRALAPLYVIHGEEALLALEAADTLRAAARAQGYDEREILTVESGFEWSALREAASSVSLFATRKLLEIRIPSGKPGTEGADALQWHAAHLNNDTVSLILLPKLDKSQLSSKWFTALAKVGEVLAANAVERRALPQWIMARMARQQQSLSADALAFFAARVEGNLLAARQEIDKLALLYPAGPLDLAQVQAAVADVARFDVFKLSEAWLLGDAVRVLRMLEGLAAEGESTVLVLWALAEELRALLRIRQGMRRGQSMPQLLRENRVWGERQKGIEPALRRVSQRRLQAALARCAEIDRMIKGALNEAPWSALQRLLLSLCQATPLS